MVRQAPDWPGLDRDLSGEVVLPGSPDYDPVRAASVAGFEAIRPQGVARCVTEEDVVAAIGFARRAGLHVAVRGGGHCFAGRSSTDGLIVDTSLMGGVSLDGAVATVGAGVRLADLYQALARHGRTVPAGCGPTVGIAGLTQSGGLGILGRAHGLTCDNLLGARVVLADGRVVDCDETREPELFWALRGAGGGLFGVVTSLRLRTVAAPASTAFDLVWPLADIPAVIDSWQGWAPDAPEAIDASLVVFAPADPGLPAVIHVFGSMAAAEADTAAQLAELVTRVGTEPASSVLVHRPFHEIKAYLSEHGPGEDRPADVHLLSKSEFFSRSLPAGVVRELVDQLVARRVPGESRVLDFLPWGGAYNRVRADATAFPHRNARFLLKHTAVIDPGTSPAGRRGARDWLGRSWGLARPWGTGGVYPGFPDPDLADWAVAYHGGNHERLVRVKAAYDPDGFFRFHQAVSPFRRATMEEQPMNDQTRQIVAAGSLFVDGDRILLVHRTIYENGWDIPGALVTPGSSPAAACRQELLDDLGLDREPQRILVVDWAPGDEFLYVFDCGDVRDEEVRPAIGRNGLDQWAWVPVDQLGDYVPENLARRFAWAHKVRAEGGARYLEHGDLP